MKYFFLAGAMGLLLFTNLFPWGSKPEELSLKELQNAPESIKAAGQTIKLETYLWRDFMPVSPPDGKPLRVLISLVPANSDFISPNLDADKVWVIFDKETWTADLQEVGAENKPENLPKLEKMAVDGPKWGPDVEVTVVVQVVDGDGNKHLLKAENQPIHKTV